MTAANRIKQDADYIFHELTRSICPECKAVIDAQVIIRDNKVYMRKRCPEHGWFEAIISSDAEMYVGSIRFNKPGTIPLDFSTEVKDGLPAGLRPLPGAQAACLPGPHRGQHRLQPQLPGLLRQRRRRLQPDPGAGRVHA